MQDPSGSLKAFAGLPYEEIDIMRILVTGGAGFIGSHLVRLLLEEATHEVLNFDALTYAGNLNSLTDVLEHPRYNFVIGDVADALAVQRAVADFRPQAVLHLAAESHVDRSIEGAAPFLRTNVTGTQTLLEACTGYWQTLPAAARQAFRFVQVSTDEVFGSLTPEADPFTEASAYAPRSPYAASKAAADHLVMAAHHTFGLPTIISHCSNNFGPNQFPEKLIPTVILRALRRESIPVYGQGENIRDWLHVTDHARGLCAALTHGKPGERYLFGGANEWRNLDLVRALCTALDARIDAPSGGHASLIEFVADRPGHDLRYAVDATKAHTELGWSPQVQPETGLTSTVEWYLAHEAWWQPLLKSAAQPLTRRGLQEKVAA